MSLLPTLNDSLVSVLLFQLRGLGILWICWMLLTYWSRSAALQHSLAAAGLVSLLLLPLAYQWVPPIEITEALPQRITTAGAVLANPAPSYFMGVGVLFFYGFYFAVAILLLLRLTAQNLMLCWLSRQAQIVTQPCWHQSLLQHASDLGIGRKITLRHSYQIQSPMTWGFFRPVILLPSEARDWNPALINSTLLHELAHIRRGDWLIQQIARIICAGYWINPLTWLLLRKLNEAAETASDAVVLDAGVEKARYAEDLLQVARYLRNYQSTPAAQTMAANTRPTELQARLMRILQFSNHHHPHPYKPVFGVLVVLLLILPMLSLRTVTVWVEQHARIGDLSFAELQALVLDRQSPTVYATPPVNTENHNTALADALAALARANEFTELMVAQQQVVYQFTTQTAGVLDHLTPEQVASNPPATPTLPPFEMRLNPPLDVLPFQQIHLVYPDYPKRALQRGIEGEVTVEFSIDEQGRTLSPKVIEANPRGVFDRQVIKAIKQSTFAPSTINGQPVKVEGARETFVFVMES